MKANHAKPALLFVLGHLSLIVAQSQVVVTVTDSTSGGWVRQSLQAGTTIMFKDGAGTPPLGKGSIEFTSLTGNYARLRNVSYHGIGLDRLTRFSYATYIQHRGNNLDASYVVLQVDINGDGRTDHNLLFDPRYQTGHYVAGRFPDQGPSQENLWQHWNMLTGAWWIAGPGPRTSPDTDPGVLFTLETYSANYAGARIINDPNMNGGGIRLTAGSPGIFAPDFAGNVDEFAIGIDGVDTMYDFEYMWADAGVDQYVNYGYGSHCTTLSGKVSGGVAPYTFHWSPEGLATTGALAQVCPEATTSYVLTVTDANGYMRTDEAIVHVKDVRCGYNMEKVMLCHNGVNLCVDESSVSTHLIHGDVLGDCNDLSNASENLVSGALKSNGIRSAGSDALFEKERTPPGATVSQQTELSGYPNPFYHTTRLRYTIPFSGKVTLKVYDVKGAVVAVLVNGLKTAGMHTVDFNAAKLGGGIYFSRLELVDGDKVMFKTAQLILYR